MSSECTDADLGKLADAWLGYWNAEDGSDERAANKWALDTLCDWQFGEPQPECIWGFVLAVYGREMSDRVFALLAAGEVENLIADHGHEFIDRIETLARRDPRFNRLLGGVWRNDSAEDVWKRIEAVRNEVW